VWFIPEGKTCEVGLEMYRVSILYTKNLMMQTIQNDLGFSLCAALSICYIVTTLDNWVKYEREVSIDSSMSPLNTRIEFNRSYLCQLLD